MSKEDGLPKGWAMHRLDAIAFVNPKKLVPDAQPDERFNFVPMSTVTEEFGGIDISAFRPFSEVQNGTHNSRLAMSSRQRSRLAWKTAR